MTAELPKPTIWVTIPPPLWALAFILAAWAVSRTLSLPIVFQSALIGWIVFIGGVAIAASGRIAFAKAGTEVIPVSKKNTNLVATGPFRLTRNPMYLGILVALTGLAIVLGTAAGWVAALAFFFFVNFVSIPYEEKKMEAQFGEDYRSYKGRVRRWI